MQGNIPSRKKPPIPVRPPLREYLRRFGRLVDLPVQYEDLLHFAESMPLRDMRGEDTLWESVFYQDSERDKLYNGLTHIYALLRNDGDDSVIEHLTVDRIDYCTFGNTRPFRIRIINRLNDNYDHFYIKKADASRIYGLELEEIFSPNHVLYLYDRDTVIEEHIAGIPGDDFQKYHLEDSTFNQIRIAKEFVKFNERCFIRLLGDMRSYNYVVDITPDIEGSQFRMRAIDFDQQSYEGRKSFYLPQYFKENHPVIFLGIEHMSSQTVRQYQSEEQSLVAARLKASQHRANGLFEIMAQDELSTEDKIEKLKKDLSYHHKTRLFDGCRSMGELVITNLRLALRNEFKQSVIDWKIPEE